jgi:hypothetical protein
MSEHRSWKGPERKSNLYISVDVMEAGTEPSLGPRGRPNLAAVNFLL